MNPTVIITAQVANYQTTTKEITFPSYWKSQDKYLKVESKERVIKVTVQEKWTGISVTELWLNEIDLLQAEPCKEYEYNHALYNALGTIGNFPDESGYEDIKPEEDPNIKVDQLIEEKIFQREAWPIDFR